MPDSRLVRFLVLGVLYLLPVGAGIWLVDARDRAEHGVRRETLSAALQNQVAQFERNVRPTMFFESELRRLKRALARGGTPLTALAPDSRVPLNVYFFTDDGKRRSVPGATKGLVSASERCLALVRAAGGEKAIRLSVRDRKLADSFFGAFGAISLLAEQSETFRSLESFGVQRSAGLFSYRDARGQQGWIVALLDHRRISHDAIRRRVLDRLRRRATPEWTFGFGDLARNEIPPEIQRHLDGEPGRSMFLENGRIWGYAIVDRRDLLYCHVPAIPDPAAFPLRHPVLCLLALAAGLIATAGTPELERRGIPIRLRTAFLFGASTLGCVVVVLGFGGLTTEARREELIRARFDQACEILVKADASYADFLSTLESRYAKLVDLIPPGQVDHGTVRRAARRLGPLESRLSIIVVATSGEVIYSRESPVDSLWMDLIGERFLPVVGAMAQQAMRQCRLEMASGTLVPDGDVARMSAIVRHGSDAMYGKNGRLTTQHFDKKDLTWYFDFIRDAAGFPVATILIAHPTGFLENLFVRRLVRSPPVPTTMHPFRFRLVPVREGGAIAPVGNFTRKAGVHLSDRLPAGLLRDLDDSLSISRAPVNRIVRIGSRPFLVVGHPGLYLSGQRLFILSSLTDIDLEIRALRLRLAVFSLLVLCFAAGLGVAFTRTLLEPMGLITTGLQRLSASDFKFHLSIRTGDEFEAIGKGLQQTIEELKDLALARNIQEHLLPDAPLAAEGYLCRGWTRSGSEIGGEIHDFQRLSDGRIAVWYAGAEGHSISSALLLGMYKTAVRLLFELSPGTPCELVARLREVFRERVPATEQGRLLIGILDPRDGSCDLAFRGSCVVFLVGREGKPVNRVSAREELGDGIGGTRLRVTPGDRVLILSEGCRDPRLDAKVAEAAVRTKDEIGPVLLDALEASDADRPIAPTPETPGGRQTRTILCVEASER